VIAVPLQRLMSCTFQDFVAMVVYVYLDDIFIFSYSESHLKSVLDILRSQELYLSPQKVDCNQPKWVAWAIVLIALGYMPMLIHTLSHVFITEGKLIKFQLLITSICICPMQKSGGRCTLQ
jgi:hypothetical protein